MPQLDQRSDPRRGKARAAKSTEQDQGKRTAARPWSDGHPTLDERAVLAAITNADITTLVRALDEGAFRNDHGEHGFRCPRCRSWSAEVVSAALWFCSVCDEPGTRYELAHRVACDAFAAVRLARLTGVLG